MRNCDWWKSGREDCSGAGMLLVIFVESKLSMLSESASKSKFHF